MKPPEISKTKNDRVSITIYNLEEPLQSQSNVGMIYEGDKNGKFYRNHDVEGMNKNLERKRYLAKHSTSDMKFGEASD